MQDWAPTGQDRPSHNQISHPTAYLALELQLGQPTTPARLTIDTTRLTTTPPWPTWPLHVQRHPPHALVVRERWGEEREKKLR